MSDIHLNEENSFNAFLVGRIKALEAEVEKWKLLYIEATNPDINIEQVKQQRDVRHEQ